MSEGPRLVAVPDSDAAQGAASAPPASEEGIARPRRSSLPWLLAGALVLCAIGWSVSAQQGRQLAESLRASNAALSAARAELAAYDAHMGEARAKAGDLVAEVGTLAERLGELATFLGDGPRSHAPVAETAPGE